MTDLRTAIDKTTLIDRAAGCLLGLAVGDAYGDLGRSQDYRQRYGIVTNLCDGAKSTDDSEFAMLTAQILVDCNGALSSEVMVKSWMTYIVQQGGLGTRGGQPL